jgi:hypothetical protein
MVKSEDYNLKSIQSKLSPQAKLYSIGYLLVFVSMLMVVIIKRIFTKEIIISLIINIIIFIISVYVVNCTVTGNCNVYAWIIAYILVAFGILATVSAFVTISKN